MYNLGKVIVKTRRTTECKRDLYVAIPKIPGLENYSPGISGARKWDPRLYSLAVPTYPRVRNFSITSETFIIHWRIKQLLGRGID